MKLIDEQMIRNQRIKESKKETNKSREENFLKRDKAQRKVTKKP